MAKTYCKATIWWRRCAIIHEVWYLADATGADYNIGILMYEVYCEQLQQ